MRKILLLALILSGIIALEAKVYAQCGNLIANPTFDCSAYTMNEFVDNKLPPWEESHGSPRSFPQGALNVVSMPSMAFIFAGIPTGGSFTTTGIKQRIGPLRAGVPHIFSFWMRTLHTASPGGTLEMDSVMFYFTDVSPTGNQHSVPVVANKQLVTEVLGLNSPNTNYVQYTVCVTPTDAWEYIWIYAVDHDDWVAVLLEDVELVDNGPGFAGPDDTICVGRYATLSAQTPGGCLSLSPAYTWYRNGSMIGNGSSINVWPTATTTYVVKREFSGVDCPGYDTVTVVVDSSCCAKRVTIEPNDDKTEIPLPDLQNPTYVVEKDEKWDNGDVVVDCDVYVPPGVTLTITGVDVFFQNCNTLIVGQGGRLEITDAHLGHCLWKGIEVWGYYDIMQRDTTRPLVPYTGSIGLVRVTNSTIDYAEIGIFAGARFSPASWQSRMAYGGGVVFVDGSTFENNYVDIAFGEYHNTAMSCGNNISRVQNSSFGTRSPIACTDWMETMLHAYAPKLLDCHIVDFADEPAFFDAFLGCPCPSCPCACASGLRAGFFNNTYVSPCPPLGPDPNNGWK